MYVFIFSMFGEVKIYIFFGKQQYCTRLGVVCLCGHGVHWWKCTEIGILGKKIGWKSVKKVVQTVFLTSSCTFLYVVLVLSVCWTLLYAVLRQGWSVCWYRTWCTFPWKTGSLYLGGMGVLYAKNVCCRHCTWLLLLVIICTLDTFCTIGPSFCVLFTILISTSDFGRSFPVLPLKILI